MSVNKVQIAERRSQLAARRAALSLTANAELEKLLQGAAEDPPVKLIPGRPPEAPAFLSFAQQRLWFLDQLEPGSALYAIPVNFHLTGPLRVVALRQSFDETIRRHESLRTNFATADGHPIQVIAPTRSLDLPVVDLQGLPELRREIEARRLASEHSQRPFDLTADPLLRVALLRSADLDHTLLSTIHHIVSDGWSFHLLVQEVGTLYKAFSTGADSPLTELPIQYADYAHWQRQQARADVLGTDLCYWKEQLHDSPPVLSLPTDRPLPAFMSYRGETQCVSVSEKLTAGLKALSQREGVTLFTTLLASFQMLLSRYSGQEDIAVGTPVAGRRLVETESLIGFFVNTLVMRTRLSGNPSIRELISRVREVVLEAQLHQNLPFEKLVEELRPDRSLSHGPLFQVMFVMQNVPKTPLEVEGLSLTELDFNPGVEKFNITLSIAEEGPRLACSFSYNTDLFDRSTIERMMGHWQRLLGGMVADTEQSIWDVPLLTSAEQGQILLEWNNPARVYQKDKCVTELFETQAERRPDAVAISFQEEQLSYRELDQRANQLAHYLRTMGVGPEVFVGIFMERSVEMIVGILGILKAGGAYVPLDPTYPKERISFILEDIRASVLLTQRHLVSAVPEQVVRVVCLDSDWGSISQESTENPPRNLDPDNAAYVIYTSGSTGQPKGVVVSHYHIARLLDATQPWFHFDEGDVWTFFHSYAFDFSVWELWGALLYGGRCVVVPYWVSRSPERFYELLHEQRVTVLNQTPSAFLQIIRAEESLETRPELFLRYVIFGGEALDLPALRPWLERHGENHPQLVNMYGITETTVHVTYRPLTLADVNQNTSSVIGVPIPDMQVYLLDPRQQLVPIGVSGEMLVGGGGVARGYLSRPELTAERFVPDPFSPHPGARLYKSGDLACFRADGDIEYLGRTDYQVKIRGHRIELGEIEATLRKCPSVRSAVVLDREGVLGDKLLVAYVVGNQNSAPSIAELYEWMRGNLPDYMLPSAIVVLDDIPLTPNGKVDRRELLKQTTAQPETGQKFEALRTPIEEILAGIWEGILGLERVERDDNFFWLGGHSLLATRVISRIREAFQAELPVRSLFEAPTLAGLAELIEETMRLGRDLSAPPLRPVTGNKKLALSYGQQRLWFLDQLVTGSSAYNLPAVVQLDVGVNVTALEQSLSDVVRRHEVLRTTFIEMEGEPTQIIGPAEPVSLPLVDLLGLTEDEQAAEVKRLASAEALRSFDLARGPLLRVNLLCLGEQRHVALVTMHHIISDGWSTGVLMHEIEAQYRAFSTGLQSHLPELEIQYADYAQWQREWLRGDFLEAELDYWRGQLAGVPTVLELRTDYPRPATRTLPGAHCPLLLPEELGNALRTFCRREGVTPFMVLMAAFQALLGRYTGQDDILVGTPIAGRNRVELESLIGFFVNMVVLRANLKGDLTFGELVGQVRESALGAYAHQDLPFDKLVEELHPARTMGRNPLFQAILAFQNDPTPEMEMAGVTLPSGSPGSADTKFDLEVYFWDSAAGITGAFVYSPELFESTTISRMVNHFQNLLEKVLADPDARLSESSLMGEPELHQVIEEWNDTVAEFPSHTCIHEMFEKHAKETPDAIAIECEQEQITYHELNRRANILGNYLRRRGVGPEVFVGVLLDRSPEMIVGLLGIAKAGGIYVPLNTGEPAKRISFMMEDAGISTVVTTKLIAENLPKEQLTIISLDGGKELESMLEPECEENPASGATAENLVYMMYTSGSTGIPKGVCITHRNVLRLVKGANYADLNSHETFLQFAPVSFDASTFEIWGCLLNGARLVLFPPYAPTLSDLGDFIIQSQVSTLWLTAGLFHQMVDGNILGLSGVKQLLAGGEALSVVHASRVLKEVGACQLINGYGPTETTTFACCYQVERNGLRASVPIGRPVSNTTVYLVNEAMRPVAIGERGELFIGGEGLARGYLNRPDLTAERFLPDPFSIRAGGRLYRTGDLASYRDQGDIEFLGRLDNQIKLRGFRLELGEIEFVLSEHPDVKEAVVLAREDAPGEMRLVAYVVGDGESAPSSEVLKSYLKERLPDYMVPSMCMMLEALPLTPNGKVDRSALPAPDRSLIRSERPFIAPRNPLQQKLAEIWEEVLHIEPIGLTDDFFEMGGHSLLVVQVIARIEARLGKRLPMAVMFQGATIEHLSNLLSGTSETPTWSLLVPIQPNGTQQPLFCIHPAGGHVFCYADLAGSLGQDQPFYGLQAREPSQEMTPHTTIEAMATEYIEAIRAFQPVGPYLLAGWSMGGIIAFEMARQLQEQDQQIALLALIDAEAPSGKPAEYNWIVLLGSFARDIGLSFDNLSVSWGEIGALPPMGQLKLVWSEAKTAGLVPSQMTLVEFRRLFDTFKANAQMMRSYAGGSYQGRITLFIASTPLDYIGIKPENNLNSDTDTKHDELDHELDLAKGWGQWATDGVETYAIPCDHYSIVKEPNVKVLAEHLRDCLQNTAKEG